MKKIPLLLLCFFALPLFAQEAKETAEHRVICFKDPKSNWTTDYSFNGSALDLYNIDQILAVKDDAGEITYTGIGKFTNTLLGDNMPSEKDLEDLEAVKTSKREAKKVVDGQEESSLLIFDIFSNKIVFVEDGNNLFNKEEELKKEGKDEEFSFSYSNNSNETKTVEGSTEQYVVTKSHYVVLGPVIEGSKYKYHELKINITEEVGFMTHLSTKLTLHKCIKVEPN